MSDEVTLTDAEREALRGLGQGQVPAVVERILAKRIAQARREGAAEVVTRVLAVAAEWEAWDHNVHIASTMRTCAADLRAALRGDA